MRVRRPLLLGLLAGTVFLGAVPLAHATFLDTASSISTFTTGTLQPATSVVTARRCTSVFGIVVTAQLDVNWGASASAAAWSGVGYRVDLLNADGTVVLQTATVAAGQPRTTTFVLTDLLLTVAYMVRVVATYGTSWTSTPVTVNAAAC